MICDAEPANGDLRPWLGFRASRCVPDRRIKANHPSPPQPFLLTDVRPRTPRASTGAGGGGFQKRSDVSFLRVITPRLA